MLVCGCFLVLIFYLNVQVAMVDGKIKVEVDEAALVELESEAQDINKFARKMEGEIEGEARKLEGEIEDGASMLYGADGSKHALRGRERAHITHLRDVAVADGARRKMPHLPTRFPTEPPGALKELEALEELEEEVVAEDEASTAETPRPTKKPTARPTKHPTPRPTKHPTPRPTKNPTPRPTHAKHAAEKSLQVPIPAAAAATAAATTSIAFDGYLQNKLGAASHRISAVVGAQVSLQVDADHKSLRLVLDDGEAWLDDVFKVFASRLTADPTDMELVVLGVTYPSDDGGAKEELELQVNPHPNPLTTPFRPHPTPLPSPPHRYSAPTPELCAVQWWPLQT
jgi:hypothetical protein